MPEHFNLPSAAAEAGVQSNIEISVECNLSMLERAHLEYRVGKDLARAQLKGDRLIRVPG